MSALGYVTRDGEGFKGQLRTLSIKRAIEIVPNRRKTRDKQPDFRVNAEGGVELGAGWVRIGRQSGNEYVSLELSAPELGPHRIYANLGRAADQDDPDVFAIIRNEQ